MIKMKALAILAAILLATTALANTGDYQNSNGHWVDHKTGKEYPNQGKKDDPPKPPVVKDPPRDDDRDPPPPKTEKPYICEARGRLMGMHNPTKDAPFIGECPWYVHPKGTWLWGEW